MTQWKWIDRLRSWLSEDSPSKEFWNNQQSRIAGGGRLPPKTRLMLWRCARRFTGRKRMARTEEWWSYNSSSTYKKEKTTIIYLGPFIREIRCCSLSAFISISGGRINISGHQFFVIPATLFCLYTCSEKVTRSPERTAAFSYCWIRKEIMGWTKHIS